MSSIEISNRPDTGSARRAAARAVLALSLSGMACTALGACRNDPADEHVGPIAARGGDGQGTPRGGRGGSEPDGGANLGGDASMADGGGSGSGGSPPGDGGGIPPTPEFTKRGLLEAAGQCAMRRYREFHEHARHLSEAVQAYAGDPDAAHREAAQDAWSEAIASWQRAELFRIGPAAATPAPGAQSLRDQIYYFPGANACLVDQQIVSQAYAEASFPSSFANARGLSAIEYLLFHTAETNACSPSLNINANGSWAALSASELTQRRADYAAAAAEDVLARAAALLEAWDPDAGDFYTDLVQAGSGSDVFAMDQDAFNALTHALYYVEVEVKDLKLGAPLGYAPECLPGPCPDALESRYALRSTDHLRQNLIGLRELFQGCGPSYSGLGFDDWLREAGAGELADDMVAAIDGAQKAVDALDPPLEQALDEDPGKVEAVYQAVKAFTDLLKSEFLTVLNLEPPRVAEGDND